MKRIWNKITKYVATAAAMIAAILGIDISRVYAQLVVPTSMEPETLAQTGLDTMGGYMPTIIVAVLTVAVAIGVMAFLWRTTTKLGRGGR